MHGRRVSAACLAIALMLLLPTAFGATAGPNYAGAVGTNSWTNPSNAVGSDETTCATSGAAINGFWKTFGFTIPSDATINGITVELKVSKGVTQAAEVYVVVGKSESTLGTEKTGANLAQQACGSGQNTGTFGSSTDLWGLSWTASDINSASFTVRVRTDDTRQRLLNWIRVTVDYTTTQAYSRTMTETVTVLDTAARVFSTSRTLAESMTASDSVRLAVSKSPSEANTISDSISKSGVFTRAATDTIPVVDALSRTQVLVRVSLETIMASDTIQGILGFVRSLSESIGVTDAISLVKSLVRFISESIGTTDVISSIQGLVRTISESISAVDVISSVKGLVRFISESVGVIDLISSVKGFIRSISESVSTIDVISSVRGLVRSISESIGVLDAIFRTIFGGQKAPEVGVPCTPYPDCVFPKPKGFAAIVLYELRMQPGETKENKIRLSLEGLKPLRTVEVLIFFSGPYLTWVSMARPMPILVEDIDKTKELDLPFWVIIPSDLSPGTYEIPYDITVSASPQVHGYHGSFKVSIYREAAFDLSWTIPLASILLAILLIRRFARR